MNLKLVARLTQTPVRTHHCQVRYVVVHRLQFAEADSAHSKGLSIGELLCHNVIGNSL